MKNKCRMEIPPEIIEYLLYHEGKLFWKKKPSDKTLVGAEAGTLNKKTGYYQLGFKKKIYRKNRVVWFLHHGSVEGDVDHKNNDKTDDRIENLRLCTQTLNNGNATKRRTNSSGFKGVSWQKGCWVARIHFNGKVEHLCYSQDKEKCALAYDKRARELFGQFAKTNFGE